MTPSPPLQVRLRTRLWMRVAAFGLLLAVPAIPATGAAAERTGRTITASAVSGARFFNDDLDLDTDISFGARVAMGLDPRWGMTMDFLASHPSRKTTGDVNPIDALRILARGNILTGRFRPYLMAGLGGILFFFNDARDGAEGAMTFAGGADYRFGSRTLLFVEGSTDIYRTSPVVYSPTGVPLSTGDRKTEHLAALSIGMGVEF